MRGTFKRGAHQRCRVSTCCLVPSARTKRAGPPPSHKQPLINQPLLMKHDAHHTHRIGRTARAGAHGAAHSFFTTANARLARQIMGVLTEAHQPVPPELAQMAHVATGGAPSEWLCTAYVNVCTACMHVG